MNCVEYVCKKKSSDLIFTIWNVWISVSDSSKRAITNWNVYQWTGFCDPFLRGIRCLPDVVLSLCDSIEISLWMQRVLFFSGHQSLNSYYRFVSQQRRATTLSTWCFFVNVINESTCLWREQTVTAFWAAFRGWGGVCVKRSAPAMRVLADLEW